MLDLSDIELLGSGLNRPECVLCHASGRIFVSDWTEGGGASVIEPDGSQRRVLARDRREALRPNGIALEPGGSFLLAHLGRTDGGLWRLWPDGRTEPVLTEAEGHPLPPTNFVYREAGGRIWVTVSTRLRPRNLAYRPDVADGFILVVDGEGARIVADGLGYTNECLVHPGGEKLYVNETFARRLSVFDIGPGGRLSNKTLVAEFGAGTYPDGLTLDAEGGLWVTSVVSNRVIWIRPDGRRETYVEDSDPQHVEWAEDAFQSFQLGRPHLDSIKSERLQNISSLAFGGAGLRSGYLGCLLGESIARLDMPVAGLPPPHWNYDLGPLAAPAEAEESAKTTTSRARPSMQTAPRFKIAVFPGDGIGPEVISPCLDLLAEAAERVGGFALDFEELAAGAAHYRDHGEALPAESMAKAGEADAILLAAMGDPEIRYPDGTEIAPQLDLRFDLGLYAGVRPVRAIPGIPVTLADRRARDLDFVLIRESTEGLFASRGKGVIEEDREARDTMVITRAVSERLFDFAFALGRKRKAAGRPGVVTCVDKANVFASLAYFRQIFDERAALNSDVGAAHAYVDATALNMVRRPWEFDVLVTENMFGDILSDLGAGLIGGMGMAPSADVGEERAVFQPCHGSAPDIRGQGKANPTAMFLSAAMMLEWLGDRQGVPACNLAGGLIRRAVDNAFAGGDLVPTELGGVAGTVAITRAVFVALRRLEPADTAAA